MVMTFGKFDSLSNYYRACQHDLALKLFFRLWWSDSEARLYLCHSNVFEYDTSVMNHVHEVKPVWMFCIVGQLCVENLRDDLKSLSTLIWWVWEICPQPSISVEPLWSGVALLSRERLLHSCEVVVYGYVTEVTWFEFWVMSEMFFKYTVPYQ